MQNKSFLALLTENTGLKADKPQTRMMALLGSSDPREAVEGLSPLAFHDLVHGVGLYEASDLVALASGEQVQACLDIDIWRKDHLSDEAMTVWLEALLNIEDEDFVRLITELDPEIISLILKRNIAVYASEDRNDEVQIPDEENHIVRKSPDFTFWIAYPKDEEKAAVLQALVDRLYVTLGVERAWSVLEAMQWELPTDLEEKAYYFRNGRMQELGFPAYSEAAQIYAPVDVEKEAQKLRSTHAQALQAGTLQDGGKLYEALQSIEQSHLHNAFLNQVLQHFEPLPLIKSQLLHLTNAVAIADGWDAANIEDYPEILLAAMSNINIGLEYLAQRDIEAACELLKTVPLKKIFTLGFNLTTSLAQKLRTLMARGQMSIIEDEPMSLLTEEQRDHINGLLQEKPRPAFSTLLPFECLADIEHSARLIADLAFCELFFYGILQKTRDDLARIAYENDLTGGVESVHFDNLALTYFVHRSRKDKDLWQPFNDKNYPSFQELLDSVQPAVCVQDIKGTEPGVGQGLVRLLQRLRTQISNEYPQDNATPDQRFLNLVLCVEP